MNQVRDWTGECHRCYNQSEFHIMSMFDCALICMACHEGEMKHPDYEKARQAEADAVKAGNLNYSGIGYTIKEIANDPIDW